MVSEKLETALKTIYVHRAVGQPLDGLVLVAFADVIADALEGVRELERTVVPVVTVSGAIDIDEARALARLYLAGKRELTEGEMRVLAAALLASAHREEVHHACA